MLDQVLELVCTIPLLCHVCLHLQVGKGDAVWIPNQAVQHRNRRSLRAEARPHRCVSTGCTQLTAWGRVASPASAAQTPPWQISWETASPAAGQLPRKAPFAADESQGCCQRFGPVFPLMEVPRSFKGKRVCAGKEKCPLNQL